MTICHNEAHYGELYCSPRERLQVPRHGELDCSPGEALRFSRYGELGCSPGEWWGDARRGELRFSLGETMTEQGTGLRTFSPKIPIFTMINPKFDWNISIKVILSPVINFYISSTVLHHLIINW